MTPRDLDEWMATRTWRRDDLPPTERLVALRAETTVAVVVPALDEEATIGAVVAELVNGPAAWLPSEVVVVDGGSRDRTATRAAEAGARVVAVDEHVPTGKGGAVWRGIQATSADVLVFLDADLDPFDGSWVQLLAAPLLTHPDVHLVKGAADRPLVVDGIAHPGAGGRVTELLARPLINALWPELAGLAQPLSGELAARRGLLERIPIARGYGVEIAMLVDALALVGAHGIGQVDLGERRHRHHGDLALGRMASGVLRTALDRYGLKDLPSSYVQVVRDSAARLGEVRHDLPLGDLPPVASLRESARA